MNELRPNFSNLVKSFDCHLNEVALYLDMSSLPLMEDDVEQEHEDFVN